MCDFVKKIIVGLLFSASSFASLSQYVPAMNDKNGYVEPFQMFDNVYYVGDKWVSSYAIATEDGLVIIDTLDFPYSEWIPINLEKLGLKDKPITHILVTHGHSDHVGGAQLLQEKYGSKVVMTKSAHELAIQQSNKSEGENKFLPPNLDIEIKSDSSMVIGGHEFKVYLTPGHTEGDYSLDFAVEDNGEQYRAFIVGGHSVSSNDPEVIGQFLTSMEKIRKISLQAPIVNVNLSNHPHKNFLFENRKKLGTSGNPFISEANFFMFLKQQEDLAKGKLEEL
ncbi:MBL fold metallo-hydrolase [Vibrio alginolyticus]|nr:MBL fold metallo-hydrolase [Vibrio alginolyticus]EJI1382563.1 MBL fold metallo-hydrolase [Vibrio alginolyticus]EKL9829763.1 MBL fold metallo-hydrolase [Vibrio alginolyticus]